MIILVDLDGVICTEEKTFERALAKCITGARESLELLRRQGHTIIVYTARSWAEYRMTKDWLDRNNIAYDSLVMGKFIYDIWIDDRSIKFEGWDIVLDHIQNLSNYKKTSNHINVYHADEYFLSENRRIIYEFYHWLVDQNFPEPILEVGPMTDGRNDPQSVLNRYPQYYCDARSLFESMGKKYISIDNNPDTNSDCVGDCASMSDFFQPNSIGTLIMLSVLEHTEKIWEVPYQAYKVLKPGGWLCLQTPWNLRLHGPRPDCWRISDDGYHALFDKYFDFAQLNPNVA